MAEWLAYYASSRGAGHTFAAIKGVDHVGATVICASEAHARRLRDSAKVNTASMHDTQRLRGVQRPVVWDNSALIELMATARQELEQVKRENIRLEASTRAQDAEIRTLKRELAAEQTVWAAVKRAARRTWRTFTHG